jgi:hypothetical protein
MAKMDDEKLLTLLQAQEDNSAAFTWGALAKEREQSMREYYRMPYGTEVDGWSSIVTSDVQDTIEWILPALLKIFTSTDQAVSFDPVRAEDVKAPSRPPIPATTSSTSRTTAFSSCTPRSRMR